MRALKAILFDMDGTLADTEEIHRQAFNQSFSEWGFDWQWSRAEYHDLLAISGGRERIRQYLQRRRAATGDAALRDLAGSVHRRKSVIYRELLSRAGLSLRPGVVRLINEAIGAGIRLGIATSSSRRNVQTLLASTLGAEAISLFQAVVTCDVVEEKKPSPAVYQVALAQLDLAAPDCIAIEDTRNGNLAALGAGLTTIITTHQFTTDNDFSGAALVLDQLGEPGRPFRVVAGDANASGYVDIALLREIVARGEAARRGDPPRLHPALVK